MNARVPDADVVPNDCVPTPPLGADVVADAPNVGASAAVGSAPAPGGRGGGRRTGLRPYGGLALGWDRGATAKGTP